MSSKRYATPLRIELRPSRRLAVLMIVGHVAAAAGLPFTQLPWWLVVVIWCVLGASAYRQYCLHAMRSAPDAIVRAVWRDLDDWDLWTADGAELSAQRLPDWYASDCLCILPLQVGARRRRILVLLPDMVDGDTFRRLRVRLRIQTG